MSKLDLEAQKLYNLLLESDEEITISEFYEKYASDEFKENSRKLEERKQQLYAKRIIEG